LRTKTALAIITKELAMTDTPYCTYESPNHPLAGLESRSATARRGIKVWQMEVAITTAARRAGWTIHRRKQVGNSIYTYMRLSRRIELCVRFSDHAPGKPLDPATMDCATMLCTLDTPGAMSHVERWLQEEAVAYAARQSAMTQGEAVAA